MDTPNEEPRRDRSESVRRLVAAMYDRLALEVIAWIKSLGPECRQSGDDSRLADVWEEFKYQVQRDRSVLFGLCESEIRSKCCWTIKELDRERQGLLWLWSEGWAEWDGDDTDILYGEPVESAVTTALYRRVCAIADEEPLAVDPDVERDRERFQDDIRWSGGQVSAPNGGSDGSEAAEHP